MSRWSAWLLVLVGAGTIAAPAAGREYITDGGFERSGSPTAAWICRGEEVAIAPASGRPGVNTAATYAGVVRSGSDFQDELVQPLLPLAPEHEYVLSIYARATGGSGVAMIGVRQENSYPRLYRTLSGEWERMELAFTPVAGWAQVVLSSAAGVEIAWDDATLQESGAISAKLAEDWNARLRAGERLYTGLVVDARGTGLQRGMSPRIIDEEGNVLFAGVGASDDQLIVAGLAAYVRTLSEATKHPRLRVSADYALQLPLVVSAQRAVGYPAPYFPPTTAVVGQADARTIREAIREYDFFGRFAVVFVVD